MRRQVIAVTRSSVTGLFVTFRYAERHERRTMVEAYRLSYRCVRARVKQPAKK
jgi:hypothetical protein